MSPEERECVLAVLADLEYLRDEWDGSISEDSLRRNSTVLRRLVADGDYSRAWRAVGLTKQPCVMAIDMPEFFKDIKSEHIVVAQHGGANHGDLHVMGVGIYTNAMTPDEVKARYELGMTQLEDMQPCGIREYMSRTCMLVRSTVAGGVAVSLTRSQLVRYVAIKKGGAHLDTNRNPDDQTERVYLALDRLFDDQVYVADLPAVYSELLAIGQAVARSDDAKVFMERAHNVLGQP